MRRMRITASALAAALLAAGLAAAPVSAAAAEGFAVCMALDASGQGRLAHTAEPFARDSARAEGDAAAFARAASAAGAPAGLTPACHWEPTREKAADYLRRLKQGAGHKAADAMPVSFSPGA